MTQRVDEAFTTIYHILAVLKYKESRWTPMIKEVEQHSTNWRIHTAVTWLLKNGYVTRPERGVYRITEDGKLLHFGLMKFISNKKKKVNKN